MRWTRRNIRRTLRGMVLAFATAAVFTGTAAAALPAGGMPEGYAPEVEAELAMIEGRAPLITRDAPDGYQPQTKAIEVATVTESGFELGDAAVGFGLGLVLATACGLALGLARGRVSTAQS